MNFEHYSVMKAECIDMLAIKSNGIYIDATVGGAGHSFEIANKLKSGKLICLDKDITAVDVAKNRLAQFGNTVEVEQSEFKDFEQVLNDKKIDKVDGILIDLGVSSYQIDTAERGFSYMHNAPLDMRMNQNQQLSAYEVVNEYSEKDLANIFFEWGEERFSRQIAHKIVEQRKIKPIQSTFELVEIIEKCVPAKIRFKSGHPAKRVFQAIRIEVNGELEGLYDCLMSMARKLNAGGRLVVLTFHSLEDRIVKNVFNTLATDCICDKKMPICICNHKAEVKVLTKKPLTATEQELKDNSRSHSAKLRVIEKL